MIWFRRNWPRARRVVALVLINLGIFLGLLVVTNLLSGVGLAISKNETARHAARDLLGIGRAPWPERATNPPFPNRKRAKESFDEAEESFDLEYKPFVEWGRRPYSGKLVNVSEAGDRFDPSGPRPPANAPVIRFFGGSTIWGPGVDDRGTIPGIFARLHPRYRVYNHGEYAYVTRQNLERLINLSAQRERTDVAVFYEGFNDAINLCRPDIDVTGHGEQLSFRNALENRDSLSELLYGRTLKLVRKIVGTKGRPLLCAGDPERARRVAGMVMNLWRFARTLQETTCGRLVVVLQPNAFIGRPRLDYLELKSGGPFDGALRAVYRHWQAAAKRPENGWLHDLTRAFDGNRPLYADYIHVTEVANEIMARRMNPLIERALREVRAGAKQCGRQG
jgi:hypothetical protein